MKYYDLPKTDLKVSEIAASAESGKSEFENCR